MKCKEALISAHAACPFPEQMSKRQREMCTKTYYHSFTWSYLWSQACWEHGLQFVWATVWLSSFITAIISSAIIEEHIPLQHTQEDEQNTFYNISNTKQLNPQLKKMCMAHKNSSFFRKLFNCTEGSMEESAITFVLCQDWGRKHECHTTLTACLVLDTVWLAGAPSCHTFDKGSQVAWTRQNILVSPWSPRNFLQ